MASFVAGRIAALIAERGAPMTLRRDGESDLALVGARVGSNAIDDTGGTGAQQGFRVRIAPTELAASAWATKAPRRHDRIVTDGRERSVLDVRPLYVAAEVAAYDLTVAG
jgi:hypothetical protein